MIRKLTYIFILMGLLAGTALADGMLRPVDANYPKEFLRNRSTQIYVRLSGQIAETVVYQEFVNEWNRPTDAVYSFPLPADARATAFFYWFNDTLYKAVLKVKEQAVNPGTGEGGIVAELNEYIGRNGIKIMLKSIPAGGIQKVQLHYISMSSYYEGNMIYTYPLATEQFVSYPLENLTIEFDILSQKNIASFDLVSHPGLTVVRDEPQMKKLLYQASKTYLNQDIEMHYSIPSDSLNVDFYSVAGDNTDGHFVLMIEPDETDNPANLLKNRVVFLIDKSGSMSGYKLEQSIEAIAHCLDLLEEHDEFNIAAFGSALNIWQNQPVIASAANIQAAKQYLTTISTQWGANLGTALQQTLGQFTDQNAANAILLFTDGFTVIDPKEIETSNTNRTGIFSIAIGDDLDRAKLEMISLLNYGFVTYLKDTDNLTAGMTRVFRQINKPMLMNTHLEFGVSDVYDMLPRKHPTIYQGHRFFLTGRYRTPGLSAFSVAGQSTEGMAAYDYRLDFSTDTHANQFAQSLWAKEMIDDIERQIAVYGETDSLRLLDIDISLKYNIRCKYTAYIADYINMPATTVEKGSPIERPEQSCMIANYPNPFNSSTNIRFFLGDDAVKGQHKFLRIYNMLGQLVAVIDISHLGPGMHTLPFHGIGTFGQELPSGIYFCQLIVGNTVSTIRMNYVK
ncbi:VWA domain-containing protein [candidate division KSB1 bacterium]|nr:VWA domain-containing protein [candidate division KSB1 bacterium]